MGRLIKNHWARLIILTSAAYQVGAAIEGFFWPKVFWDFLTRNLDVAVKPIPVLQIVNLVFGVSMFALEWPFPFIAGSGVHRSLEFRLAVLPLTVLASALMYQSTNSAIYYLIGMAAYLWAYSEGEMICAKPWTLPQRGASGTGSQGLDVACLQPPPSYGCISQTPPRRALDAVSGLVYFLETSNVFLRYCIQRRRFMMLAFFFFIPLFSSLVTSFHDTCRRTRLRSSLPGIEATTAPSLPGLMRALRVGRVAA